MVVPDRIALNGAAAVIGPMSFAAQVESFKGSVCKGGLLATFGVGSVNPHSAPLRLVKCDSGINGLLPDPWPPIGLLPFIPFLT
jgi:hypothetical protein